MNYLDGEPIVLRCCLWVDPGASVENLTPNELEICDYFSDSENISYDTTSSREGLINKIYQKTREGVPVFIKGIHINDPKEDPWDSLKFFGELVGASETALIFTVPALSYYSRTKDFLVITKEHISFQTLVYVDPS